MAIEIVDLASYKWCFFHSYVAVYQRVQTRNRMSHSDLYQCMCVCVYVCMILVTTIPTLQGLRRSLSTNQGCSGCLEPWPGKYQSTHQSIPGASISPVEAECLFACPLHKKPPGAGGRKYSRWCKPLEIIGAASCKAWQL